MNHDAPASITPKPAVAAAPASSPAASPKASGGFWSFLRTLFIGSAGLAVLAVVATLAGSAWLTANQRAEADKAQPWADPSFTTTAVTTGGMLARFMDADGNLDNGHSYVKGIYDLWKVKQQATWTAMLKDNQKMDAMPQLWQAEINADIVKGKQRTEARRDAERAEAERIGAEARRKNLEFGG